MNILQPTFHSTLRASEDSEPIITDSTLQGFSSCRTTHNTQTILKNRKISKIRNATCSSNFRATLTSRDLHKTIKERPFNPRFKSVLTTTSDIYKPRKTQFANFKIKEKQKQKKLSELIQRKVTTNENEENTSTLTGLQDKTQWESTHLRFKNLKYSKIQKKISPSINSSTLRNQRARSLTRLKPVKKEPFYEHEKIELSKKIPHELMVKYNKKFYPLPQMQDDLSYGSIKYFRYEYSHPSKMREPMTSKETVLKSNMQQSLDLSAQKELLNELDRKMLIRDKQLKKKMVREYHFKREHETNEEELMRNLQKKDLSRTGKSFIFNFSVQDYTEDVEFNQQKLSRLRSAKLKGLREKLYSTILNKQAFKTKDFVTMNMAVRENWKKDHHVTKIWNLFFRIILQKKRLKEIIGFRESYSGFCRRVLLWASNCRI